MNKQVSATEDYRLMEELSGGEYRAEDNSLLYCRTSYDSRLGRRRSCIVYRNLTDGSERILTAGGNTETSPRFSPDGKEAAFLSDADGSMQVWICCLESGVCRKLTCMPGSVMEPLWSPDGSMISFLACPREAGSKSYIDSLYPEGVTKPVVIEDFGYKFDGAGFVKPEHVQLHTADVKTGEVYCLTAGNWDAMHPAWSPDSSGLAYISGQGRSKEEALALDLFLVPARGGESVKISKGDWAVSYPNPVNPVFTPDGKFVIMAFMDPAMVKDEDFSAGYPLCRLHRVAVDGSGDTDIFKTEEYCYDCVAFPYFGGAASCPEKMQVSEDGQCVYFISGWHGQCNIYRAAIYGEPKVEKAFCGEQAYRGIGRPQKGKMLAARGDFGQLGDYFLLDLESGEAGGPLTGANSFLKERALSRPEVLEFDTLDGRGRVQGFVVPPQNREPGRKYPAVLYIHGGPHPFCSFALEYQYQCLAARGFAVIYCNFRGSSSFGKEHLDLKLAYGGTAAYDCLQMVEEAVRTYEWIDPERIGVTGGSFGGYLTSYLASHTKRFKACVAQRAVYNELMQYASSDMQGSSREYKNFEEFMIHSLRDSVVSYAENITVPFLILHGEQDYRCPVEGAHQMFTALKECHPDLPVRMILWPKLNHDIPRDTEEKIDYLEKLITWFEEYV